MEPLLTWLLGEENFLADLVLDSLRFSLPPSLPPSLLPPFLPDGVLHMAKGLQTGGDSEHLSRKEHGVKDVLRMNNFFWGNCAYIVLVCTKTSNHLFFSCLNGQTSASDAGEKKNPP